MQQDLESCIHVNDHEGHATTCHPFMHVHVPNYEIPVIVIV